MVQPVQWRSICQSSMKKIVTPEWANAPVLVKSATHKAPAIIGKRRIYSSQVIVFQYFPDELWDRVDDNN
jgi:hypothetical protein